MKVMLWILFIFLLGLVLKEQCNTSVKSSTQKETSHDQSPNSRSTSFLSESNIYYEPLRTIHSISTSSKKLGYYNSEREKLIAYYAIAKLASIILVYLIYFCCVRRCLKKISPEGTGIEHFFWVWLYRYWHATISAILNWRRKKIVVAKSRYSKILFFRCSERSESYFQSVMDFIKINIGFAALKPWFTEYIFWTQIECII